VQRISLRVGLTNPKSNELVTGIRDTALAIVAQSSRTLITVHRRIPFHNRAVAESEDGTFVVVVIGHSPCGVIAAAIRHIGGHANVVTRGQWALAQNAMNWFCPLGIDAKVPVPECTFESNFSAFQKAFDKDLEIFVGMVRLVIRKVLEIRAREAPYGLSTLVNCRYALVGRSGIRVTGQDTRSIRQRPPSTCHRRPRW